MNSYALGMTILVLAFLTTALPAVQIDLTNINLPDRSSRIATDLESELAERRQAYVEEMEELRQEAIEDLQREESRERDQLMSLRIQMEIERIAELDVTQLTLTEPTQGASVDLFGTSATTPAPAAGAAGWQTVVVDGSDPAGTSLGPIKATQTVWIRYVSGQWNGVNPDLTANTPSHRCILVRETGKKLADIPLGTSQKPFGYTFRRDRPDILLKNDASPKRTERNQGSITYAVKIE